MFTQRKKQCLTLTIRVYTTAISSVNKIVINEWLRLNISGFLMSYRDIRHRQSNRHSYHCCILPPRMICRVTLYCSWSKFFDYPCSRQRAQRSQYQSSIVCTTGGGTGSTRAGEQQCVVKMWTQTLSLFHSLHSHTLSLSLSPLSLSHSHQHLSLSLSSSLSPLVLSPSPSHE